MPVILDNGSEAIRTWLDPDRTEWSNDLQSLLKPYEGSLECYPVTKDVGKVGNNSPSFLVPINSAENKNNIANFFGNQKKAAKAKPEQDNVANVKNEIEASTDKHGAVNIGHDGHASRATTNRVESTEDNAPLPVPAESGNDVTNPPHGIKRERSDDENDGGTADAEPQQKVLKPASFSASPKKSASPTKSPAKKQGTRSATSNGSAAKTSPSDGNSKITAFFNNK